MNKIIKAKPILFSCFLFGIAFFVIYAATTVNTTFNGKNPGTDILSADQGTEIRSESLEERAQALSILENDSLTDTSRGEFFRNTYQDPTNQPDQEKNKQETLTIADLMDSALSAAEETAVATEPADLDPNAQTASAEPAEAKPITPAEPVVAEQAPAPAASPKPEAAARAKPEQAAAKTTVKNTSNLDLLARLITAEAQGEPHEAQVAVGAVVMNRVKSGDWPDTIRDVIYQNIGGYYQFTPVVNGWIDKPALPDCIEAAKEAMGGTDPTNGAQFYYDDKVTNTWILAKPVSVQYGHMIFAF